jgi:hypothetical protein
MAQRKFRLSSYATRGEQKPLTKQEPSLPAFDPERDTLQDTCLARLVWTEQRNKLRNQVEDAGAPRNDDIPENQSK